LLKNSLTIIAKNFIVEQPVYNVAKCWKTFYSNSKKEHEKSCPPAAFLGE
jgi:hypothetical protein